MNCISTPPCQAMKVLSSRYNIRPQRNVSTPMLIDDDQLFLESPCRKFTQVTDHERLLMPMLFETPVAPNAPKKAPFAMRPRTLSEDEVLELGFSLTPHVDAEAEMMSTEVDADYWSRCNSSSVFSMPRV